MASNNQKGLATLVVGLLLPGAGHYYLGQRAKGILIFILITVTFILGWGISNFNNVFLVKDYSNIVSFFVQMLNGIPAYIVFTIDSLLGIGNDPDVVIPFYQIGIYFTWISGMMNVLIVMDAMLIAYNIKEK